MLPVVWSERLYKATGTGWHRAGTEVRYDRSWLKREGYKNPCACLSFTYQFKHADDKVYFAYAIPYTFSMLTQFIGAVLKVQESERADNKII